MQRGQSEVEDLDGAVPGDRDVPGLDVAVDDAARVRLGEPVENLRSDANGFLDRHGPTFDPFPKSLPVTVGHGDERPTVFGLADLVDRADVGVIQSGRGPGFPQKASLGSLFSAEVRRQELQRHEPVQLEVPGLVDHSHTALAEALEDLEMRDRLADHPQARCRQKGPGVTASF